MPGSSVVFVIGAGASVPFGLPTAAGLRDLIIKGPPSTEDDPGPGRSQSYWEVRAQDAKRVASKFAEDLKRSGVSSVDRFLEGNPDKADYGKFAIANKLLLLERDVIWRGNPAADWHSWLIERLLRRKDALFGGQFTFITFNYDRLIHAAFYYMIRYATKKSHSDTLSALDGIPIIHVYGRLGSELNGVLEGQVHPNYDLSPGVVRDAAKDIQIISDERAKADATLALCRQAIKSASRVVFLGFGYDRENLERIGATGIATDQGRQVHASAYGLEKAEQQRIRNLVGFFTQVGDRDHDCLRFLRATAADWIEN